MTELQKREMFNDMVCRYSERLYWHIRSMVVSHDDADDVLQNVYLKAWKSISDFREDSGAFTWLWRIATNESLNFLRARRVRAALSLESLSSALLKELYAGGIQDGDDAQSALTAAIVSLPPKQKAVFCMRYYEDLPYEEIAEITGTSVGALKASYHMAAEKVKESIKSRELE
ncbi:MAG: RNA polymerase sigma factor [Bacteroidales bacterium]|nr:RNA polymerase sigma factor [Bacteroidales bacterium]